MRGWASMSKKRNQGQGIWDWVLGIYDVLIGIRKLRLGIRDWELRIMNSEDRKNRITLT